MIIIHGGATFEPHTRDRIEQAGRVLQTASQREDGCIHYSLTWDLDDPNTIHLLEIWVDADAHAAHRASEPAREFTALAAESAVATPVFHRYEGTPAG